VRRLVQLDQVSVCNSLYYDVGRVCATCTWAINLILFGGALHFLHAAPLFHMANITPEAMGDDRISEMLLSFDGRRVEVTKKDLCESYKTLDSGRGDSDDIALVALGNPHLRCALYLVYSALASNHPVHLSHITRVHFLQC